MKVECACLLLSVFATTTSAFWFFPGQDKPFDIRVLPESPSQEASDTGSQQPSQTYDVPDPFGERNVNAQGSPVVNTRRYGFKISPNIFTAESGVQLGSQVVPQAPPPVSYHYQSVPSSVEISELSGIADVQVAGPQSVPQVALQSQPLLQQVDNQPQQIVHSQTFSQQLQRQQPFNQHISQSQSFNQQITKSQLFNQQIVQPQSFNQQISQPQSYNHQITQPQSYNQQISQPQLFNQQIAQPHSFNQENDQSQTFTNQLTQPQQLNQQFTQAQSFTQQISQPQLFNQQASQPQSFSQQIPQPQSFPQHVAQSQPFSQNTVKPQQFTHSSLEASNSQANPHFIPPPPQDTQPDISYSVIHPSPSNVVFREEKKLPSPLALPPTLKFKPQESQYIQSQPSQPSFSRSYEVSASMYGAPPTFKPSVAAESVSAFKPSTYFVPNSSPIVYPTNSPSKESTIPAYKQVKATTYRPSNYPEVQSYQSPQIPQYKPSHQGQIQQYQPSNHAVVPQYKPSNHAVVPQYQPSNHASVPQYKPSNQAYKSVKPKPYKVTPKPFVQKVIHYKSPTPSPHKYVPASKVYNVQEKYTTPSPLKYSYDVTPTKAPYDKKGKSYNYHYGVGSLYHGTNYRHQEKSDGDTVSGEYRVQLPDGRVQIVSYTADPVHGFRPTIRYVGAQTKQAADIHFQPPSPTQLW